MNEVRLNALLLPSDDSPSSSGRCSSGCDLLRGRFESQHHLMVDSRAEDSAWDPSSARPPSQPAKTREESACLSIAPPVVHMTQFGITHTHRLAHGPIHSGPHTGWAQKSLQHARPHRQILRFVSSVSLCASICLSVSVRRSSATLGGGCGVVVGAVGGRAGAFSESCAGSTSQLPHCSIVSTLWQTNTLTCPGS